MPVTRKDTVDQVLRGRKANLTAEATAYAPADIALCKYWGKRDGELNLPVTSSLSISLGKFGSKARFAIGGDHDSVTLNGRVIDSTEPFARRLFAFLDLFRPAPGAHFQVNAENSIPTAAGFASSASGFAVVVLALNKLFGWQLDERSLSILAGSEAAAQADPSTPDSSSGMRAHLLTAWTAMPNLWPRYGRSCVWACWWSPVRRSPSDRGRP